MAWRGSSWRALGVSCAGLTITALAHGQEPACALAITLDGVEGGAALKPKLAAVAQREGACDAKTWALRIAPGPKNTFVVALWNGEQLETRFATGSGEIEPVASLLLRVALARRAATEPAAASAPVASARAPSESADSSRTSSSAPSPKGSASAIVALEAGPVASAGGVGGDIGVSGLWLGRTFGAGPFVRYGAQGAPLHGRSAFEAGALGVVGGHVSERVWLGGVGELGVSVQRANGEADGSKADASATGVTIGGGGIALLSLGKAFVLGARATGRWSSANAAPRQSTTSTTKPVGNGNGNGRGTPPEKTTTTVTTSPASQEASDALGGGALALTLLVGYAF
jgi:hypothetical protein